MGLQITDVKIVIRKIRRNVILPITSGNIAQYESRRDRLCFSILPVFTF